MLVSQLFNQKKTSCGIHCSIIESFAYTLMKPNGPRGSESGILTTRGWGRGSTGKVGPGLPALLLREGGVRRRHVATKGERCQNIFLRCKPQPCGNT